MNEKNDISLRNLVGAPGARRRPLRLGMGEGSGTGQTATRGQKGQRSRSGDGKMPGFEGGQTPLLRRVPKRGFTNGAFRHLFQVVSLDDIQRAFKSQKEVAPESLRLHGLIKGRKPVKILGGAKLSAAYQISAHAFSGGARKNIEEAGGKAMTLKP